MKPYIKLIEALQNSGFWLVKVGKAPTQTCRASWQLRVSGLCLGMLTGSKYGLLIWAPTLFLVLVGFEVWALVLCMVCNGHVRIPD